MTVLNILNQINLRRIRNGGSFVPVLRLSHAVDFSLTGDPVSHVLEKSSTQPVPHLEAAKDPLPLLLI